MAVITISREPGALGEEVAARVAGLLGFLLVDRAPLAQFWQEMDLDEANLTKVDEGNVGEDCVIDPESEACIKLLPDLIAQLAEDHDMVVIGRGGHGSVPQSAWDVACADRRIPSVPRSTGAESQRSCCPGS